jgi:phosphoribosylformimino-5-aminoimidazole carboxamide ribotide isomerase
VSIDAKDGFVAQRGWQETSTIRAIHLAKELERLGVATIIYTDIAKDGMLQGPNFNAIEEMLVSCKIPLIASGGVSSLADIKNLAKLETRGLLGAITGKALYEGKLNLKEAIRAC